MVFSSVQVRAVAYLLQVTRMPYVVQAHSPEHSFFGLVCLHFKSLLHKRECISNFLKINKLVLVHLVYGIQIYEN